MRGIQLARSHGGPDHVWCISAKPRRLRCVKVAAALAAVAVVLQELVLVALHDALHGTGGGVKGGHTAVAMDAIASKSASCSTQGVLDAVLDQNLISGVQSPRVNHVRTQVLRTLMLHMYT